MAESLFTKIINRQIPADIVYEDEFVIAFNDISPQAPVHILIVPKKPVETVNEFNEDDVQLIGRIVLTAKKLAAERGIAESGYRLIMNTNADGGQSVFHVHCHLMGGRVLNWPPG